jgi:hypothetical protein
MTQLTALTYALGNTQRETVRHSYFWIDIEELLKQIGDQHDSLVAQRIEERNRERQQKEEE